MEWIIKGQTSQEDDLVECIAEIRQNSTGIIIEYNTLEILEPSKEYPNTFNWEENNNSCDCNREIYFNRAQGIDIDFDHIVCSDGKYSVNLKNKLNGYVYYREFEN